MTSPDAHEPTLPTARKSEFSTAEIGALAHLYRGEVYRSTVWRTRLDSSTNWAVVTTGIALSATYSSAQASPLPMVLVGLLVSVFLLFEARRYRYFNVWRARARLLETDFYAPMIRGEGVRRDPSWTELLAKDYVDPRYHISFARAIGRHDDRTDGNLAVGLETDVVQSAVGRGHLVEGQQWLVQERVHKRKRRRGLGEHF